MLEMESLVGEGEDPHPGPLPEGEEEVRLDVVLGSALVLPVIDEVVDDAGVGQCRCIAEV